MKKIFSMLAFTLAIFAVICNVTITKSEAKDYWFYSEGNKEYYIDNEQSDFRAAWGDKHLLIKIVVNNKIVSQKQWDFGFDEGSWYFSPRGEKGSGMSTRDVPWAQAAVEFGQAHWTNRGGFRE